MAFLYIIIGLLLLLLGRKLFWLFVALIGFVAGFHYAPIIFDVNSELTLYIIALITGTAGALLAVFLQAAAIAAGGFLAGGYIAATILGLFADPSGESGFLIAFIIGGLVGAILLFAVFDYALIVISSLAGSVIITDVLTYSESANLVILLILFVFGVIVQTFMLNKSKRKT